MLHDLSDGFLNDYEQLGGWFRASGGRRWRDGEPFAPSVMHGRSACVLSSGGFVAVKGVGWTWAAPRIHRSTKDARLTFGLLAKTDAARELSVSRWLSRVDVAAGEVLGFGCLRVVPGVDGPRDVTNTRWTDGTAIEPCLLYTRHRSPYRVADLGFVTEAERGLATAAAAEARGWNPGAYIEAFASDLGRSLAVLHTAGCVNDTLSPDNITLAAELTDFEWFTVPGIALPDGSTTEILAERQEKELVYATEIVTQLSHYLGRAEADHALVVRVLEAYRTHHGPREGARESLLVDADHDRGRTPQATDGPPLASVLQDLTGVVDRRPNRDDEQVMRDDGEGA